MAGGGAIWTIAASQAASAAIAGGAVAALTGAANGRNDATLAALNDIGQDSGTAYRPSQWANQPMLTSIVLPGTAQTSVRIGDGDVAGETSNSSSTAAVVDLIFVFDAVLIAEHEQSVQKTQHPVQNGANIADHAFIQPARLTLQIGMSDAMDSFAPGQWGTTNKGPIAYQQLVIWAKARQVMTVNTRLRAYPNMLIVAISSADTVETQYGLKAQITFEEIFTGTIAQQQVSADPQKTDETSQGTKQVQIVDPALLQQHSTSGQTTVPNSGSISSNVVDDPAETGS